MAACCLLLASLLIHFLHLLPDTHDGIKRGERVLKNHADMPAADLAHAFFGRLKQVFPLKGNSTGGDLPFLGAYETKDG